MRLEATSELKQLVDRHDEAHSKLEQSALALYRDLVSMADFVCIADRVEREHPDWKSAARPESPVQILAEMAINLLDYKDLEGSHSGAAAWAKEREAILQVVDRAGLRDKKEALRKQIETARDRAHQLEVALTSFTERIADKYHISPDAPPTPSIREHFPFS